jgi:hypothetical protein
MRTMLDAPFTTENETDHMHLAGNKALGGFSPTNRRKASRRLSSKGCASSGGNFNSTFSPVTVPSSATLTPEEAAMASQARLPFL